MTSPDVAVIGGGIVGCSAALFLARGGARVRLYERERVAGAASGRNSGVVQRPFDPVLGELYRDTLELYRALEAADPSGFRLPPEPAGLLLVASDPAVAAATARAFEAAVPGTGAEVLDAATVATVEPSLAPDVVACRVPIGFPVAPAAATLAIADLAGRAGVEIRQGTEATPVVDGDRATGVRILGPGEGEEPAGAVIVAAGPWSPALVDPSGGWRPIRAIWGVVVEVGLDDPPRHVLEEAGIDASTDAGGEVRGSAVEFSLVTAAGRSALGSTFLEDPPDPASLVGPIVDHGGRFVPAVRAAPILGHRMCARPLSADGAPLLGPVAGLEGLWIAAGHGPWGISTGPASARLVADAILDGVPIPPVLAASRFGPALLGPPD